jgi:uncharacterized protein (TIGR00255 family)
MLLSMTGFGEAQSHEEGVSFRVEIRSVNNRYFKSSVKLPEQFQRFEGELDKQLRAGLGRGSVMYTLRVKDESGSFAYQINESVLDQYVQRLGALASRIKGAQIDLASLLDVPGVCEPPEMEEAVLQKRFAMIEKISAAAIVKVIKMRRIEGEALLKDLSVQCTEIRRNLAEIQKRSPMVVEEYQRRLLARVQQLVSVSNVALEQDALVREVAVFAERCDVNEEIARLSSHMDQFAELCASSEETGRKLDFLAQEMLREANTIGSKASDSQISRHIVEIKSAIDRVKEQVQNVA